MGTLGSREKAIEVPDAQVHTTYRQSTSVVAYSLNLSIVCQRLGSLDFECLRKEVNISMERWY